MSVFSLARIGARSVGATAAVGVSRMALPATAAAFSTTAVPAGGLIREPNVLAAWKTADAVCFDVDSTVVTEEGIDVLAAHCGAGEAVSAWTLKAMSGDVPFDEALAARLAIIEPSMENIRSCEAEHPLQLTPGLASLFETLEARGTHVYLVSGGFRQMINPIADILNISRDRIFANNILFKEDGSYNGFDKEEPTAWAGGKARVVGKLVEEKGYSNVFMVGDGATDMEARPPANHFIGFGGIAERKVVRDGACWYVTDLNDLITPLKE